MTAAINRNATTSFQCRRTEWARKLTGMCVRVLKLRNLTFGVSGRRRAQRDGYRAAPLLGAPLDAGVSPNVRPRSHSNSR
jgi:hypothetical protein